MHPLVGVDLPIFDLHVESFSGVPIRRAEGALAVGAFVVQRGHK
jgi:hypothetical protein